MTMTMTVKTHKMKRNKRRRNENENDNWTSIKKILSEKNENFFIDRNYYVKTKKFIHTND